MTKLFEGPREDNEAAREQRLINQLSDIKRLMADGSWRTLQEINELTGHPPASISAQLRHLRKKRFGGHTVEKEHVGSGLYRYRLLMDKPHDPRWRRTCPPPGDAFVVILWDEETRETVKVLGPYSWKEDFVDDDGYTIQQLARRKGPGLKYELKDMEYKQV